MTLQTPTELCPISRISLQPWLLVQKTESQRISRLRRDRALRKTPKTVLCSSGLTWPWLNRMISFYQLWSSLVRKHACSRFQYNAWATWIISIVSTYSLLSAGRLRFLLNKFRPFFFSNFRTVTFSSLSYLYRMDLEFDTTKKQLPWLQMAYGQIYNRMGK